MAKDNDKFSAFIMGLLAGGIAGSIIAMLYTPITGRRLRRKIADTKDEIVDDINEYYKTGKEKAEDIIHESKKKAESLISEAKKIVSN